MKKTFFLLLLFLVVTQEVGYASQSGYLVLNLGGQAVHGEPIEVITKSISGGIVKQIAEGETCVCMSPLTIVADFGRYTPALAEVACSTDVTVDATVTIEVSDDSGGGNIRRTTIRLKEMRVTSFQFGAFLANGGGSPLAEIEVEKEVDRTSVPLVQACSGGSAYEVDIMFTEMTSDGRVVDRSESKCLVADCN